MRQTRDLARVGWRGLAPFLPIGPHERPRLADSFSRLGQARGASPGSLDQRSEEWSLFSVCSSYFFIRAPEFILIGYICEGLGMFCEGGPRAGAHS